MLAAGECVFGQCSETVAIYRVQSGRIRLVRHLCDGSSVIMHVARPG